MRRLKILTWHVHGSYLYYLAQTRHEFFLPVKPGLPEGYGGRTGNFAWPANVHDVAAEDVRNLDLDCIIFQSKRNYCDDQYEILSHEQQRLPRIHVEHDPPREHPTDTRHFVDDENVLLVHVTAFNDLMWDSGRTPTYVIDHGVMDEGPRYTGEIGRGISVVNGLPSRGRRLGADVFARVREEVPIDLAGLESQALGGVGDIPHDQLLEFESRYRFFFNPIRYTSMGLSVCEAMMCGIPVVGLATTEMATAIENGVSGYVDTSVPALIERMNALINDPVEAKRLGTAARHAALERFNIRRFADDWDGALALACGRPAAVQEATGAVI